MFTYTPSSQLTALPKELSIEGIFLEVEWQTKVVSIISYLTLLHKYSKQAETEIVRNRLK